MSVGERVCLLVDACACLFVLQCGELCMGARRALFVGE